MIDVHTRYSLQASDVVRCQNKKKRKKKKHTKCNMLCSTYNTCDQREA